MATSDIMKQAVYDARIVQLPARYAVEKGGLSITNAPYNSISASASQHTYNINVPSQNVFVDRAVDWSSYVYMTFTVRSTAAAGQPIAVPGKDFALAAFPLHQLTQTMTSTINDTNTTINTDTVLQEVLRLTDYRKNRLVRHCPTALDRYASYADAANAINSSLNGYLSAPTSGDVGNGSWWNLVFTSETGAELASGSTYNSTVSGITTVITAGAGGVPVVPAVAPASNQYQVFVKWYSSEKLVLSPFIFADSCEWETGIFGVNNIQLVMNLKSSPKRALRFKAQANLVGPLPLADGVVSGSVQYFNYNGSPFQGAQVNVQYLTPSLDIPLPAKSIVPYTEFPRYVNSSYDAWGAGETSRQLVSQTIVLPQIPDMLVIYCKPKDSDITEVNGDFYFPLTQISINFDNFAGLLSSHTEYQLYQMAAHNGLAMDYNQWRGLAYPGSQSASATGSRVQTVGGFLIIRPGQDFGLQSGQAPSLIGNFTLQFNCTAQKCSDANNGKTPVLYVIAVNSGFFETLAGSSRIIKGVLSEADIISAEPVLEMTRDGLKRIVGNGFFSKLGSMLSKGIDIYTKTKPAVSALKGMLPEGKVKDVLGKVGYGMAGAAAPAGAGKKSLSARLM